jgi:CheY-like chemotaxis protein
LLLVDDEMMVRTTTARIAQHFGFSVLSAADGPEALKLFTEHQAEITGVLLDLTMPNMSGEDVLRALRHRAANVPVIIMSGYSDQSVLTRLNDQAGVWFLQKPFTPQALQSLLQSAFPDSAV